MPFLFTEFYHQIYEDITRSYYGHKHNMPITEEYNGIYSLIYESESDNDLTWIIYVKRKGKKLDHPYLVHGIDKDILNKMTSKYMEKYYYEEAEISYTAPFLNEDINNLKVDDLDETSLKKHLFYRVRFRLGEKDYKSIEYSIFGDECFIKDY